MISINWSTKVITIPQADLTPISGSLYELDVDDFRLVLKDIEDSAEGMAFPDTHRHSTAATLSGVTYARIIEIINGYTLTFEDTGTPYVVRCVGANHNLADVKTVNNVSLIVGNAAGLITGSGMTAGEVWGKAIDGERTAEQILRLLAAILGSNMHKIGDTYYFRDTNNTKDRASVLLPSNSQRVIDNLDLD